MRITSRRKFLGQAIAFGCGLTAWGMLPGSPVSSAFAVGGNGRKTLFINMNGGWDGLQVCQPNGGALYDTLASMRPTLKSDPTALLPLDRGFGLHPALSTLKGVYDSGQLATILNVGYLNMSRSHLDAEVAFARGITDRLTPQSSGFINRLGYQYKWSSFQAVSVSGTDHAFEGGEYRGIQVEGLGQYRFIGDNTQSNAENIDRADVAQSVALHWPVDASKGTQREVADGMVIAGDTADAVKAATAATTFNETYPQSQFGRSLRDVEVLFSSPSLGTEIAYVRRGGFDTHSQQSANLPRLLAEFDAALGVFVRNMKARGLWNSLTVVVISEFGRTNRENGSLGTDHGGAVPVFVLGGGVKSGVWGDIAPTTLTSFGWLPMQYPVVEIYRQVIGKMGYDPNLIFEISPGPSLGDMFV